jgi:hypothetical protein
LPFYAVYIALLVILLVECGDLLYQNRPVKPPLDDKNVLLTSLPVVREYQGYKMPRINESVDGRLLTSGDRLYKNGIGTHAPSQIAYELPENADTLYLGAGIDDEVYDRGQARFSVKLDGVIVWESPTLRGRDNPVFTTIPVRGGRHLELLTDPDGDDNSDHADWLNAYLKLR